MVTCSPCGGNFVCGRVPYRARSGTDSRSASPPTVRHSHLWEARNLSEFFQHRLRTSMTRATLEHGTASLGQTLRTGRPLVGGVVLLLGSRDVHEFTARRNSGSRHVKAADAGPGLSGWFGQLLVIHTPWVAIGVVSSAAPPFSTTQPKTPVVLCRQSRKAGSSKLDRNRPGRLRSAAANIAPWTQSAFGVTILISMHEDQGTRNCYVRKLRERSGDASILSKKKSEDEALQNIVNKLSDERDRYKKHYHMSTAQFMKKTTHLEIP